MTALLLAVAIGQVEDVDDLRERWQIPESVVRRRMQTSRIAISNHD